MALVDEVRKRLDATYEEALFGLERSGGDLLNALAAPPRHHGHPCPAGLSKPTTAATPIIPPGPGESKHFDCFAQPIHHPPN